MTGNEEDPVEFINGKCDIYDDVTIDFHNELTKGTYVAFVEIEWVQS